WTRGLYLAGATHAARGRQADVELVADGFRTRIHDADQGVGALAGREEGRCSAARQVVGRPDVALAEGTAEAVLEGEAQQRQGLGVARAVDDARAQQEAVRLARVGGGTPLAQFVGREVGR